MLKRTTETFAMAVYVALSFVFLLLLLTIAQKGSATVAEPNTTILQAEIVITALALLYALIVLLKNTWRLTQWFQNYLSRKN